MKAMSIYVCETIEDIKGNIQRMDSVPVTIYATIEGTVESIYIDTCVTKGVRWYCCTIDNETFESTNVAHMAQFIADLCGIEWA